jgi:pimeloyl-ACP methyl ester carboxylesterase
VVNYVVLHAIKLVLVINILHSRIIGQGSPLLILHGFLGSGDNWITLGRRFSDNYEVHLIDLRNHGRSFHDDEMDLELMCNDIYNYCQNYKLNTINIIGHSLGGKVAMHLSVAHVELISKLIIVDIAPKSYQRRHDFILNALQAVDFSKQKTREAVAEIIGQHIKKKAYIQFLLKAVYRKDRERLAFRFNLPVFIENYGNIVETLPTYSQYNGDTLFVKGALSDYILDSDTLLIKAHFPKSEIVVIKQTDHWLHAEKPDEFYRTCTKFLES